MPFQDNIANLIVPEVFNPYWLEQTTEKTRVLAPMVSDDNAISQRFRNDGSRTVHVPFFKDLEGDSQGLGIGEEINVERIESGKDIARRHMRGKGWTVNDLESELTSEDPLAAIASRVGAYWAREAQRFLFLALDGVFAENEDNEDSDLIYDNTGSGDTSMTRTAIAKAKNKLGDSGDMLTMLAIHSDVYTDLEIRDEIRDERDSEAALQFETYAGYQIIVDDKIPVEEDGVEAGVDAYTSYLFAPNSVAYANNFADVPSELDRKAELSETRLFTRIHFMMHPRGYKWVEGDVDGETPSYNETASADNWERVYQKKNIRFVKLITTADVE